MFTFAYLPNRNKCKLTGDKFDGVREFFSEKNPNAYFIKKRNPFISERFYAMTPTGLFETGMFFSVLKYIQNKFPDEKITFEGDILSAVKPTVDTEAFNKLALPLRDYQLDAVQEALKAGRGIIKLGTGGGKTLTIASLLTSVYLKSPDTFKCLLIVPDLTLVNQTFNDFLEYKVPITVTRWTGSLEPDLNSKIIIANTAILQSQHKENRWINDVSVLVVDECHKLRKGNELCNLISQIKTHNKFGLTGSLPEKKVDEWNITGILGHIFFEKTSSELNREKFLTDAEIKIVNIKYNAPLITPPGANKYRHELDFIYQNKFRNAVIGSICKKFNNNILVLVNHINHGQLLYDHLSINLPGKKVFFIRGEVEVNERSEVIKLMEKDNDVVCVAISAIFSTGVNIKNLHMIIFAAGGKSFIRTVQSIGRGLRLNPNKEKLTIIDIADQLKYSTEHSEQRKTIYDKEKIQYKTMQVIEK